MSIRENVRKVGPYHFTAHDAPVKLDQNESPWPLPIELRAELEQVMASFEAHRYPDLLPVTLRSELARRHDWAEDGVTVTAGSNVLIQSLIIAAGIGRTVLCVSPTFSVYALQARLMADRLVEVPLQEDFSLDLHTLKRKLAQGSGVLFLANPAAPTGNLHPEQEVEELLVAAGERWLVVIDEAYQQFSPADHTRFARSGRAVVLRTLSKAAGLAGVRLGYALSTPDVAEQLQKTVMPFSVSRLQERVALAVLAHDELLRDNVRALVAERERVQAALADLTSVHAWPSAANFILFRISDASAVHAALLKRGVLVRRQDHLPGLHGCLRVSIGLPEENSLFLSALTAIMEEQQALGVPT